jgi:hypothetical protein
MQFSGYSDHFYGVSGPERFKKVIIYNILYHIRFLFPKKNMTFAPVLQIH